MRLHIFEILPLTRQLLNILVVLFFFFFGTGLDLRGHTGSGAENPGATLRQTPEQGGVHERDGPVLRLERARGQVSAADQRQHNGAQLAAGREQVSGPIEAGGRRLVQLVRLGRVRAERQRQRVRGPVPLLEQDVHEPGAQVRRRRLPRAHRTGTHHYSRYTKHKRVFEVDVEKNNRRLGGRLFLFFFYIFNRQNDLALP